MGTMFDFQEEILAYTRDDVNILRESWMEFRDMFREITFMDTCTAKCPWHCKVPGSDCFASAAIASCAMQFLRQQTFTEFYRVVTKTGRDG